MIRIENGLDIYYAVGNINTSRKESEIGDIIKKINSLVLQLGSMSNAVVDTNDHFQIFICFGRKNMSKNKEDFIVLQGMTLLLLKKLSLPPNLGFQIILYLSDPVNFVGYED